MVRTAGESAYVAKYRKRRGRLSSAWDCLIQEESWRRTDLRSLDPGLFRLAEKDEYQKLSPVPEDLAATADCRCTWRADLAAKPGAARVDLNPDLVEKGVVFTDLRTAEEQYPEIVEKIMGKIVRPAEGKFAALSAALAQTGVLLYVPRGVVVEQPLHSLLWGPGKNLAHITHLMVYLEEASSVTYVHEAASPKNLTDPLFHAGTVEILRWPGGQPALCGTAIVG